MKRLIGIAAIICIGFLGCQRETVSREVLSNGSFAEGLDSWEIQSWLKDGQQYSVELVQDESGEPYVALSSAQPNHLRLAQTIKAQANTVYLIRGEVRGYGISSEAAGACFGLDSEIVTSASISDEAEDWQPLEWIIKTYRQQDTFTLFLNLGSYGSLNYGSAHFRRLSVEEAPAFREAVPVEIGIPRIQPSGKAFKLGRLYISLGVFLGIFALLVVLAVKKRV